MQKKDNLKINSKLQNYNYIPYFFKKRIKASIGTTLFDKKVKRIYTDRLTNRDKIEEQFQIYCTEYKTEEL